MDNIVYLVELDVVTVTNDISGYGTPLTANTDGDDQEYSTKTLKFTNSMGGSLISGYMQNISSININTPTLKAGNGVASRATVTINFIDSKGDPDEESPAVIANQDVIKRGTYFGKLMARHLISNNKLVIKEYNVRTNSVVKTFEFLAVDMAPKSNGVWTMTGKDILYRISEDGDAEYPKPYSAIITNSPGAGNLIITTLGDASNWDASKHVVAVGDEVMNLETVSGTTSSTLTVEARGDLTIGSGTTRSYTSYNVDISSSTAAVRYRKFENATLDEILVDIFNAGGITSANYDQSQIETEINNWLGVHSFNCIFKESRPAIDWLNDICELFLIDIYTDISGQIQVKATSPWQDVKDSIIEGKELTFNTGSVVFSEKLRFSRVMIEYNELNLSEDNTYANAEFKYNSEYEGSAFYGDEKLKKLPRLPILSNSSRDNEIAQVIATRFVNRWSLKPKEYTVEITTEAAANYEIGQVLAIQKDEIQRPDGMRSDTERAQITSLKPKSNQYYTLKATSFEPYEANTGHIVVTKDKDINLFIEAGSPPPEFQLDEYTFVLKPNGQTGSKKNTFKDVVGSEVQPASITSGDGWSGTKVIRLNVVLEDGVMVTAKGGNGGLGGKGRRGALTQTLTNGESGGIGVLSKGYAYIYMYLFPGTTVVDGVSYEVDGYLWAPGGGGGAGASSNSGTGANVITLDGGNGGGGLGYPMGYSTPGAEEPSYSFSKLSSPPGTFVPGVGENLGASIAGADGGYFGEDGDNSSSTGGSKGKSLVNASGGAVWVNRAPPYTGGDIGRLITGDGDTPYNSLNPPPNPF